jgi:AraC-like DNA-binding protein
MAKREFKILPCAVIGTTAVEADTRHTFSRHTHEQFGVGVIVRGAHKSQSCRGMVEAIIGNIITVNAGEVHDGAPIGDAGRCWRMLYFDPPRIAETVSDISEGKTQQYEFHHPVIRNDRAADRFHSLFDACTCLDGGTPELKAEALALLLLREVMRKRRSGESGSSSFRGIAVAKSLIDDQPTLPITLSDLARASGLSRFQVLRGFIRSTGLTPHAYLVQRRIDLARRLIAGGTRLADAAAASGFSDQSHMTGIFVRKYGLSPASYAAAIA